MAGTGAVMRQDIGGGRNACMVLCEMHSEHRQEISGRADARRLLEGPEKRLRFRGAAALLHAGIVVLRIGRSLAWLQVRLVEILPRGRRIARSILIDGRRLLTGRLDDQDRTPGLLLSGTLQARLLEPLGILAPLLPPLGAAQDLRTLGQIGMMPSEVVLAGGVPPVRALGVENAWRRHQEDAEEQKAHEPAQEMHSPPIYVCRKLRRTAPGVNGLFQLRSAALSEYISGVIFGRSLSRCRGRR